MLKAYNTRFLDHIRQTGAAYNDAETQFGVRIQPADVAAGETYWRVIGVHHLTPEENRFNHHIYIEALDEAGNRLVGPDPWAGWTWEGREPSQEARPQPLDKGANEPAGNIPLGKRQIATVWINGFASAAADKSDRVTNLHTGHPDEPRVQGELWNSLFHHSFYVVFQRARKEAGSGAQPGGGQSGAPGGSGGQVAGPALPPGATVQFWAEPATIKAGQEATLHWDVEGLDKVFLDSEGGAGHEVRTVRPANTTTYTLNVTLRDSSKRTFEAKVIVESALAQSDPTGQAGIGQVLSPGATRPPTVRLSAENIAQLKTFPRPPFDNGIGLHFHIDLSPELIQRTVANLKSIRATWTLIYAQDEQLAERAATPCFRAGIMPVVRIGKRIDESVDSETYVHALRKSLAASDFPHDPSRPPLYVQIYNEPEDMREWLREGPQASRLQIFGRNWAQRAARVHDAGGYPGIQVLDRNFFDAAVDAVASMGRQDIWRRAFFVHHNYGENHPPEYPYDARNQQDKPGCTIMNDYICALKFLAHAAWMQERLGFVLPLVGGEGGWLPGGEEDRRYPKIEPPRHAQYTREMFEWLRTGVLANGEPLPDYLFSITAWTAGSWTFPGQNWWDNSLMPDGKLTQTIEAMQAMPTFIRRFSWDR